MIKARILIVEDEAIIARDLSRMLQDLGHTILDTAMTGEEAMAKTASLNPDVVLMDIRLAGKVDGVSAAIRIRETLDTPIMFLTGNTDDATLERAKTAAPFAFLSKPVSERELQVCMEIGLHKAELERRVTESERNLSSVLGAVGDGVIGTDAAWMIGQFNPAAEEITGWSAREALGHPLEEVLTFVAENGSPLRDDPLKSVLHGDIRCRHGEHWLRRRDGSRIVLSCTVSSMRDNRGAASGAVCAFRDISERVAMDAERERLIGELQAALESIKTLSGLIPICAACKQIRDDQGFWQSVEQYVEAHSQAHFTHGICPKCVVKFYADEADGTGLPSAALD